MSPPRMFLSLLVILTTLQTVSSTATFNCRRTGQSCKNAAPCGANGACICDSNVNEGFDCGIVIADINATACTPRCQNGGVCQVKGDVASCYCTQEFFGSDCTLNRVEILCFGNRKTIYVNPVGFIGKMYITGYSAVTECQLLPVADISDRTDLKAEWTEGRAIRIMDVNINCGNITSTTEGTTVTYDRFVKIEYDLLIMTTLDELLKAGCQTDDSGLRALPGRIIKSDMANSVYTNRSTVNVYEPLVFSALSDSQPLGDTPLLLGKDIEFKFIIPQETGYDSVIVETLQANDTLPSGATLEIITSKCPMATSVITSFMREADNRTVIIVMKVFKFMTSDSIGFTGTARICKAGDNACDESTTCTSGTALPALGRRKRETGDKMTIQQRIQVTTDPEAAKSPSEPNGIKSGDCPNPSSPKETHCLQRTEIIVVLALLASAVLVLMIACVVLTWKLLRTSPKVVDLQPSEYMSSRPLPRLTPSNF